jgi:hypothetical protein
MRVRSLVVGAVTALVAVLGLPSAAHATPLITKFECSSASRMITCDVEFVASGKVTIEWEGGPNADLAVDQTRRMFPCGPRLFGLEYVVQVRVIQLGVGIATNSKPVVCNGNASPRASNIFCQPMPSVGLPNGTYFRCDVVWGGDGSAATVRWVNPRANRQPVVRVNSPEGWTTATFDCNNPGGPDLTFGSHVTIADAMGTMTTPATIPCGW